jgi:hypothetical protein
MTIQRLRKEERKYREQARADADKEMDKALERLRAISEKLEAAVPVEFWKEHGDTVSDMAAAFAMVDRRREAIQTIKREERRARPEGEIEPGETLEEWLDLGVRLAAALDMNPDAEDDVALVEAALEACAMIHPITWDALARQNERRTKAGDNPNTKRGWRKQPFKDVVK